MEKASTPSKKKQVVLFFTGFGKFGKVLENPTTKLSRSIKDLLAESPIDDLTLFENYIVTVSIEDCDEALAQIYQKINELIKQED
jgi:hypothetical protein